VSQPVIGAMPCGGGAAAPSIAGTTARATVAAPTQARIRQRTERRPASMPAPRVPMPARNHGLVPAGVNPASAYTSRPRKTIARALAVSAEERSPRTESARAAMTKTAVAARVATDRTPSSLRSGLKNVKTMAATANSPAPAAASTACRVVSRRGAGPVDALPSGRPDGAGAAGPMEPVPAMVVRTPACGIRGTSLRTASRASIADAACCDSSHRACAAGEDRSAPQNRQRDAPSGPRPHTGHVCGSRRRVSAATCQGGAALLIRLSPPRQAPTGGCRRAGIRAHGRWRRAS